MCMVIQSVRSELLILKTSIVLCACAVCGDDRGPSAVLSKYVPLVNTDIGLYIDHHLCLITLCLSGDDMLGSRIDTRWVRTAIRQFGCVRLNDTKTIGRRTIHRCTNTVQEDMKHWVGHMLQRHFPNQHSLDWIYDVHPKHSGRPVSAMTPTTTSSETRSIQLSPFSTAHTVPTLSLEACEHGSYRYRKALGSNANREQNTALWRTLPSFLPQIVVLVGVAASSSPSPPRNPKVYMALPFLGTGE